MSNQKKYKKVIVYHSGNKIRNNIGNWKTVSVDVINYKNKREFFFKKDERMSIDCDFGFVIWDNKSKGTYNNIIRLKKMYKQVVIFSQIDKKFLL